MYSACFMRMDPYPRAELKVNQVLVSYQTDLLAVKNQMDPVLD